MKIPCFGNDTSRPGADVIHNWSSQDYPIDLGVSWHLNPEFESDIDGFSSVRIRFDDALGMILQYRYQLYPGFQPGLRLTEMEYEGGSITDDASSIGLFLACTPRD